MKVKFWVGAIVLLLIFGGCSSEVDSLQEDSSSEEVALETQDSEEPSAAMPNVVGDRLDSAKSQLGEAGYKDEVDVRGGGTFGVVVESNWIVCAQEPPAGESIDQRPALTVDRSCGDGTATDDDGVDEVDSEEPPAPASDGPDPGQGSDQHEIDAGAMEAAFLADWGGSMDSMCAFAKEDPSSTGEPHWACFYSGVEAGVGYLQVNLTTHDQGDWNHIATTAGNHWFNFIGCDFPNLDMIVVSVNGLDHNIPRSSTNADRMCG